MLDSSGDMTVRAFTAGGALPVEGAVVRIMGAMEENRLVSYSLLTNRDGLTSKVALPAPSAALSLSPDPKELPYSLYDVEITAPGYYTKRINSLSVFPGISSVQLINMIPGSGYIVEDYPGINNNIIISDNTYRKE